MNTESMGHDIVICPPFSMSCPPTSMSCPMRFLFTGQIIVSCPFDIDTTGQIDESSARVARGAAPPRSS
jgi:hypothetical protein